MSEQQNAPEGTGQESGTPTPPWGSDEDFNPEKAWGLIQNLRGDLDKAKSRPVLTDDAKTKLAEYDRWAEASKSELTRAQEETQRWQAEAERWRTDSVQSRVQALASDFADPSDAASVLNDPNKYLGSDGVIDEAAIKADLAAVLEQKPHWRRPSDTGPRTPAPNRSQGAGGASTLDPSQQFASILQGQLGSR